MINKVKKVMREWKHGQLHSGSKKGPVVRNQKQAVAIALSEQRKANSGGYGKGGPKVKPYTKPHMNLKRHPVSGDGM